MQNNVYDNGDHEQEGHPLVYLNQRMSERNQEAASPSVTFRQYKPVYKTRKAQEAEKNKRYHIDYPQLQGPFACHLLFSLRTFREMISTFLQISHYRDAPPGRAGRSYAWILSGRPLCIASTSRAVSTRCLKTRPAKAPVCLLPLMTGTPLTKT